MAPKPRRGSSAPAARRADGGSRKVGGRRSGTHIPRVVSGRSVRRLLRTSRSRPPGRSIYMDASKMEARTHWTVYESPIGPLTGGRGTGGLTNLHFRGTSRRSREAASAAAASRSISSTLISPPSAAASSWASTFAARPCSARSGAGCSRSPTGRRRATARWPGGSTALSILAWSPRSGPGRRRRERPQPRPGRRPLPPGDRRRRLADRLRRRPAAQACAARAGGRPANWR